MSSRDISSADTAKVLSHPLQLPKVSSTSSTFHKTPPRITEPEPLVGFNATYLHFANEAGFTPDSKPSTRGPTPSTPATSMSLTSINLNEQSQIQFSTIPFTERRNENKSLVELRNYTAQMDNFTRHTFNIYGGKAVKNSPEYFSYQKDYASDFGAISVLIKRLEEIMSNQGVRHAVIDGQALAKIAILNPPYVSKEELFKCIVNFEQIQPQLNKIIMTGMNIRNRAALKIQTYYRMKTQQRQYQLLLKEIQCAIKLQAIFRSSISKIKTVAKYKLIRGLAEKKFHKNQYFLQQTWSMNNNQRVFIILPSIPCHEYLRLHMSNINHLHNCFISCLFHLFQPNVHIVYVCPFHFSREMIDYYEKFLVLIGISVTPRRFHFVTPEVQGIFPSHLSLSHALWFSSVAIKKIKNISKNFEEVFLVPTGITFVEKRLVYCLDCPLIGPNPSKGEMLASKSFVKRVFMDCCVNIPVGAHDISNEEDFMVALCRLITSNIDVERWGFRLNTDYNNETYAYFEPGELEIIRKLRIERQMLIRSNENNPAVWFANPVQLSVRKRLMPQLVEEIAYVVNITKIDIFPSWKDYCNGVALYGALIEAEHKVMDFIDATAFITPSGDVESILGVNSFANDKLQIHSFAYPQSSVSQSDIFDVMKTIAENLHTSYEVIGYFSVRFSCYCDSNDGVIRIYGQSIHLGFTPLFGAAGTTGILGGLSKKLPSSSCPDIPKDRFFAYVPLAYHQPLVGARDEAFFRLAKMHRIVYDMESKTGTLFFLVDSLVGGAVSILCVGNTRKRAIEHAVNALNFINQQFGKDSTPIEERPWFNLSDILHDLKIVLRKEKRGR